MMLRPLPFVAVTLAFAALGCSDAPPRPAKLGLAINIKSPIQNTPETMGRTCPTQTGVQWDIGKAIRMNGMVTGVDSPTASDYGTTLEDGQGSTKVTCTVKKTGSVMAVGSGIDPQITPPDGLINFTFNGTAKKDGTGTALVSIYTPKTLQIGWNTGLPRCAITAVHELQAGALWADFSCPVLTDPGNPSVGCEASGTIVVEYCKTGEEED
jgi:hypothetical protein